MARILILSLVFAPDGVSTATIVSELAHDLHAKGHEVRVITTVPHYNEEREARERQPLTQRFGGLYQRSTFGEIPVWHTAVAARGESTRSRAISYLLYNTIGALLGLFALPRHDVILIVSPPLTSSLTAWLIRLFKGGRIIYNVQEIYPDAFIDIGSISADGFLARALFRLERFTYNIAAAVSVISQQFRERLLAKGVPDEKIHVIPNFVDTDFITPGDKDNPLAREHDLVDKFVVLYAGNLGMTQPFEMILEAAGKLADLDDLHFLIVGDGVQRQAVLERVAEQSLTNVTILPYQPRSRVPAIYASADVGLVPLKRGLAGTTLPSKIYTIMSAGRAVLAAVDEDSAVRELVERAEIGRWVPPDDADAFAEAVRALWQNRDATRALGQHARAHVVEHYARSAVVDRYDALIREVAGTAES